MKVTYLPHALRRMDERGIARWEAEAVLEAPDVEYPGHVFERVVAELQEAGGEGGLQSGCPGRTDRRHRGAGQAHPAQEAQPGGAGRR